MLGERRFRRLLGHPRDRVTVPALIAGVEVLRDSWEIAVYAERVGQGAPLIGDAAERVRYWHELAERAMSASRALVIARSLASPEALDEALAAPAMLRPLLRPLARHVMRWFARKYELDLAGSSAAAHPLRMALDELRAALQNEAAPPRRGITCWIASATRTSSLPRCCKGCLRSPIATSRSGPPPIASGPMRSWPRTALT